MWVMVDIEADGPCPGLYSMTEIGAVAIVEGIEPVEMPSFYSSFKPISDNYVQQALDVCGHTREGTMEFDDPAKAMQKFASWLGNLKGRPRFISDNNGFDWQFVNYYCWKFLGGNPFGHSSTNQGSLYKGMVGDVFKSFKHLRKTKHTHHPVDDCVGNVEALLHMKDKLGLKISFK